MLALTLLAATLAVAAARPLKATESYAAWAAEFSTAGSIFEGSEARFTEALAEIAAHNADKSQTWSAGVNKFTAMTKAEFKAFIGRGYSASGPSMEAARKAAQPAQLDAHVEVSALPASLDWREKTPSVVTKVKDQGGCGGCWSFSAAETLESNVAINTGTLLTLSEQQILACTPNPNQCGGTGGCSGATQELAFQYVQSKGIATEANWPYTMQSGKCDYAGHKFVANVTGWAALPFNNYTALMNAVVSVGPIAISAAAEPWQSYDTGVFSSPCGADVDHAIVLEGYGTDSKSGLDYYLVRNSWSAGWGEGGYIRVARYGGTAKGEPCLTDTTPGDGDGCKGGPSKIQVCGLCGILSDSSYAIGGYLL